LFIPTARFLAQRTLRKPQDHRSFSDTPRAQAASCQGNKKQTSSETFRKCLSGALPNLNDMFAIDDDILVIGSA